MEFRCLRNCVTATLANIVPTAVRTLKERYPDPGLRSLTVMGALVSK